MIIVDEHIGVPHSTQNGYRKCHRSEHNEGSSTGENKHSKCEFRPRRYCDTMNISMYDAVID